jgi:hypothetical protein
MPSACFNRKTVHNGRYTAGPAQGRSFDRAAHQPTASDDSLIKPVLIRVVWPSADQGRRRQQCRLRSTLQRIGRPPPSLRCFWPWPMSLPRARSPRPPKISPPGISCARSYFCVYATCRWSAWEAVTWVTETTFQPKRIAGDKKSEVRQTVRSTARATKPTSQLSVQKIRFCNSGRSRGRVARSRLQRSRQTVERKR